MGAKKNWFYNLPADKQNEYCSRLKGKRKSKYCQLVPSASKETSEPTKVIEDADGQLSFDLDGASKQLEIPLEANEIKSESSPELSLEEMQAKRALENTSDKKIHYYDVESEHEWAKISDVKNIGEDLKGSSRHRRNAFRDWNEKDLINDVSAKINRDKLEEQNCPDFENHDEDLMKAYALRECLNQYPSSVPIGNENEPREELIKRRTNYVNEFNAYSNKLRELLCDDQIDAEKAIADAAEYLRSRSYSEDLREKDRLLKNALFSRYRKIRYGKNGAYDLARQAYRKASQGEGVAIDPYNRSIKNLNWSDHNKAFLKNLINGTESLKSRNERSKNGMNEGDIYKNNKDFKIDGSHKIKSFNDAEKVLARATRGVQFGNAMNDNERQKHVLAAVNSLEDLSAVTGLSLGALTSNGKLGLAFGARGAGKAAAHFESGNNVINLTRSSGYGSFAHEIGHALDYYAGTMHGAAKIHKGYLTGDRGTKDRPESVKKIDAAISAISKRIEASSSYRSMTPHQKKYWTERHEIFARMFESFVNTKLSESGRTNTYLVKTPESALWPTKEEVADYSQAMVDVLKEIEKGYVAN